MTGSYTAQSSSSRWFLRRPVVSAPLMVLLVTLWIVVFCNQSLWSAIAERINLVSMGGVGYVLTLGSLMWVLLLIPSLVFGQRYLLKPLLILLLLVSALLAYFTSAFGVVYDVDMVRNAVESVKDRNTQEAAELMSPALLARVVLLVGLPVALIVRVRVTYGSLWRDQLRRLGYFALLSVVSGLLVLANFKSVTYVTRENDDLEIYLNPHYALKSVQRYASRQKRSKTIPFVALGEDATQQKSRTDRLVGVMVVGETARADHFSLNGYVRDTNPLLSHRSMVNFSNATSCGTSTAYSVPCMFSFLTVDNYSPEKAAAQSNALDVLQQAGVRVIWVDSNSSCKGVCSRIESHNLIREGAKDSPLFVEGAWHDEVLLQQLPAYLDESSDDVLLVLHSIGSHGPAYYRRYPERFAHFTPYCKLKALQDCTLGEIINAYDNSIRYTDYVLAALIDQLAARQDASFLLYASDHGESLGENGIYLHGIPRMLAPKAQTSIPILAWFSPQFLDAESEAPVRQAPIQSDVPISHDHLSATLLGLYDVRSEVYEAQLDLFPTLPFNEPPAKQASAIRVAPVRSEIR